MAGTHRLAIATTSVLLGQPTSPHIVSGSRVIGVTGLSGAAIRPPTTLVP